MQKQKIHQIAAQKVPTTSYIFTHDFIALI